MSAKTSTDKIELLVALYREGQSAGAIGRRLGLATHTVTNHLRAAGVELRSMSESCRKYPLDEAAFAAIETEAQAYWLGFITADGGVSDAAELRLNLQLRDKPHLERLREFLGSPLLVRETHREEGKPNSRDSCYFSVRSVPLCEALARHGVPPRKSKILRWPNTVPEHLVHHYVRGFFDGNGGWCNLTSEVSAQWRLYSTHEFLLEARIRLVTSVGLPPTELTNHHSTPEIAYLIYCTAPQVIAIAGWMYHEAEIFLPRKYDQILGYLSRYHST